VAGVVIWLFFIREFQPIHKPTAMIQ